MKYLFLKVLSIIHQEILMMVTLHTKNSPNETSGEFCDDPCGCIIILAFDFSIYASRISLDATHQTHVLNLH